MLATLAVTAPRSHLLEVVSKRGGVPRKVATATLLPVFALVVRLFAWGDAATPVEPRITQFIGAWGLWLSGVGLLVIAAVALVKIRDHETSDDEP